MMRFIVLLALADPAITTLTRGPMSAVEDSTQVVARTAAEWTTLWKSHAGAQAPPAVDFSIDMVAAVFMGTQATGGFGVEIVGTRRDAEALIIEYVEQRPGRRDVTAQVLTSPFHIVKLPRHDGPIRFERRPNQ
jgi:PrcB C-terminal